MELTLVLFKSLLLMGSISMGVLIVFIFITLIWVRRNAKGKVYAFFVNENREITAELLEVTENGRIKAEDKGEYVVTPQKTFFFSWPPGFPSFVREPIPAVMYVHNNVEPFDPGNSRAIVTAESLRYMQDEAMLRQTWLDAREAAGGVAFNKSNLTLYIIIGVALANMVMGYMLWIVMTNVGNISQVIGV
jgi:hypothetical protein